MEQPAKLTEDRILIEQRITVATRIGLLIAGLVPLLAPWELLVRPYLEGRFPTFSYGEGGIPALIMAFIYYLVPACAFILSVMLCFFAVCGMSQFLLVNASRRELIYRRGHPLSPIQESAHRFEDVVAFTVTEHTSSDGPATYCVRIDLKGDDAVELGYYPNAIAAEAKIREIRTSME